MRCLALGALALVIVGCRTHTVDDCRPACVADDQTFFAHCVANGLVDPMTPCEAGNRRCCALAADCIGQLDDQTVVSTQSGCVEADTCFRPCDTAMDPMIYEACVSNGTANCRAGDETCCALAADCLGDLGDVTVSAEGCCQTTANCPSGLTCSTTTWMCASSVPTACGDGIVQAGEDCDDHNTITEDCAYGAMSCTVCNAACHSVGGATHFCGDGTIDLTDGETCEPPNDALICDASCHSLQPTGCANGILDGTETDIDCGGRCAACTPGRSCQAPNDCRSEHLDCGGTADCNTDHVCVEMTRCGPVTGRDICLDYGCPDVAGACANESTLPRFDHDHDGHAPSAAGCGDDCDDLDPNVFLDAPEHCNHIDDDCDEMVDEACTP